MITVEEMMETNYVSNQPSKF